MSQAAVTSGTGVNVGVQPLDERSTAGYHLTLELHRDELECRASLEVHDPAQAPLASDLLTYLKTQLVEEAINEEQDALFCAAAAKGKSQTGVLLAVGKEPTCGENSWFDFAVRTSDAEAEFVADEHGTVDLRTRHTFSNIEPEMLIGRVMPPFEILVGQAQTLRQPELKRQMTGLNAQQALQVALEMELQVESDLRQLLEQFPGERARAVIRRNVDSTSSHAQLIAEDLRRFDVDGSPEKLS